MTRVVSSAEAVVELSRCCDDLTVAGVTDHLLAGLSAHLSQDLRTVVVAAAAELAAAHACTHGVPTLNLMSATSAVGDAFDRAVATGTLDETISGLDARGIDGERVTWDVISRESLRHEGLIHKECNRLARTLPDRSPDELKGYGWVGLRVALRNFDPDMGFAFSTYACPKINGTIRDGVRAESPIPKRLTTFLRKVSKAEETLTHELSRIPTYAEIAAFVDSSTESLHLVPRLAPAASIEELSLGSSGEHTREPACLVDAADPEAAALTALRNQALYAAVDTLPVEEAQAIRLLLLEELPVSEAAAIAGVEARQLRMRKQRALRALKPLMRAWVDEALVVSA